MRKKEEKLENGKNEVKQANENKGENAVDGKEEEENGLHRRKQTRPAPRKQPKRNRRPPNYFR